MRDLTRRERTQLKDIQFAVDTRPAMAALKAAYPMGYPGGGDLDVAMHYSGLRSAADQEALREAMEGPWGRIWTQPAKEYDNRRYRK